MNSESAVSIIGKSFLIQLCTDAEPYTRQGKKAPILPFVKGHLIRKIHTWTWCYLAELSDPLFLDVEGIGEEARKKISANYIKILPSVVWSERKKDNLAIKLRQGDEMYVSVFYVEEPKEVPNELLTGEVADPFFEKMPTIASGIMSLKE